MNRKTERICSGHYLINTKECGYFSLSKHEGRWRLRQDGHLIEQFSTKKDAMREISGLQATARRILISKQQSMPK